MRCGMRKFWEMLLTSQFWRILILNKSDKKCTYLVTLSVATLNFFKNTTCLSLIVLVNLYDAQHIHTHSIDCNFYYTSRHAICWMKWPEFFWILICNQCYVLLTHTGIYKNKPIWPTESSILNTFRYKRI